MTYHEEVELKYALELRAQLEELPPFINEFFCGIANTLAPRTKSSYAREYKIFFDYLTGEGRLFYEWSLQSLTLKDLDSISTDEIEAFLEYLTYYKKENKSGATIARKNGGQGKSRKLAALRTLFSYF